MSLADVIIAWGLPVALLFAIGSIGLTLVCLVLLKRVLVEARDACHIPELCKHRTAGGRDFCEECRS